MPKQIDFKLRNDIKNMILSLPRDHDDLTTQQLGSLIGHIEENLEGQDYKEIFKRLKERVSRSKHTQLKEALIDVLCDKNIFNEMEGDSEIYKFFQEAGKEVGLMLKILLLNRVMLLRLKKH